MARSTIHQLAEIGNRLAVPPDSKDAILKSLKQAASLLSEMEQLPESATLQPLTRALVRPTLLRHKDKDVRLITTTCILEITRILAPSAPYSDEELKEIFQLIVTSFRELDEIASPGFTRRTTILEIMARFKICVVMLDLECDELILEMFQSFFSVVSEKHPPAVLSAMQTIMILVLEESEEISQPLLETILSNLLKESKCVSPAAHDLAVGVVEHCADKLEPYVQRFLTSIMLEGKTSENDLRESYHDIIYEIYQCAPQMLLAVIPNLTQELMIDQVDVRLKAVQLLGRLFTLPGQHVAKEYRQLFGDFLKRFTDKAAEVRLAMVECAKECLQANPSGHEATEFLAGLCDRILDNEDKVRLHVVNAICDVAKSNLKCIPMPIIKQVAERLRDKKVFVRKEALQKLVEVYRAYSVKCYEGYIITEEEVEWIPSKIIRCCFDKEVKEFRPAGIEITFSEELFAAELPVEDRTKHWILFYGVFDENDRKALARMLSQKQRLQEEMLEYLSLRQKGKKTSMLHSKEEHNQESQNELHHLFKSMSSSFTDDQKAEECFQKLHLMKDNNIFKGLTQLLDTNTTFFKSQTILDDLLKRIGESHPQHEFIKQLALRCSFRLFGKEHIQTVVEEIRSSKEDGNKDSVVAGLSLLAEFTGFSPLLIEAVKEELVHFLMDDDESVKERVAEILAKAGGFLRGQIGESSSPVELTLQKLCLEGSRKQAKYAVSALSAINTDSGFRTLSMLYARLVDNLVENNPWLPTVLQSLSCIAQNAITIFETQEDDIISFVVQKLLRKHCASQIEEPKNLETDWNRQSTSCNLKIFGLKTLVKSFLPNKEHPRKRLMGLLGVLYTILPTGEISDEVNSSEMDKAHLRLAAAKGVLRIARRLDAHIPPHIFHACLLTSQDPCVHVRLEYLLKVQQYLKDHTLSRKYACAFALYATESSKEILVDAKHYLADFVEVCHREARLRHTSIFDQNDTTPITHYPEYVLTYLVQVLAHHPTFLTGQSVACADAYEPFYRMLLFYLRSLVHQEGDAMGKKDDVENLPAVLAIFRTVKKAEDASKDPKTAFVHTVCDLGIAIVKEIGRNKLYSESYFGVIPLPSLFYKVDEGISKVDGSDLPSCLTESDALFQFWSRCSRLGQNLSPHAQKGLKRVAGECAFPHLAGKEDTEGPSQKHKKKLQLSIADRKRVMPSRAQKKAHQEESSASVGKIGSRILRSLNEQNVSLENEICASKQESDTPSKRKAARLRETNGELAPLDQNQGQPRPIDEEKASLGQMRKSPTVQIAEGNEACSSEDLRVSGIAQDNPSEKMILRSQRVAKRLKLEKHNYHKIREAVAVPDANQKTLPEIFNNKCLSRQNNHQEDQIETDSGDHPHGVRTNSSESPVWKPERERETDEKLVGSRIRVWCQTDQRFYAGVIQSFDCRKNEHKVLHDDGNIECLELVNERWDIINQDSAEVNVAHSSLSNATASPENQHFKDHEGCSHAYNEGAEVPVVASSGQAHHGVDVSSPNGQNNIVQLHGLTKAVATGRVLRDRFSLRKAEPAVMKSVKNITVVVSDDEPTATWRSRRRKVK